MKSVLPYLFLLVGTSLFSQIYDPVSWSTQVKKITDSEYELTALATIEEGWHMYSQNVPENGPLPTTFYFEEFAEIYMPLEKTMEDEGVQVNDPVFNMKIKYFEGRASFIQRIKLLQDINQIEAYVEFMVCDDERCLPPKEVTLLFRLDPTKHVDKKATAPTSTKNNDADGTDVALYGMAPSDITTYTNGNAKGQSTSSNVKEDNSLLGIFALGFLGGLLALLTPCVFPMIPLTVSFFTKNSAAPKNKGIAKALLYGFFIIAVYVLLSVPFHLMDSVNPDILNEIATHAGLNIFFFIIFLFFAFSFFGFYEITLPSSWTSKTTQGENLGGYAGIFFMALTLAIVSFSCTGPILGSLLVGSLTANGGAWQLTMGMTGFGVALGLPFALFAMFPNMMNALPKSGGWLNSVKVVLGFLELALAFKFLSNADLVQHWGILKLEPFLLIWIIIFAAMALYLLGVLKFPHDTKGKKPSVVKLSLGILTVVFTGYLATGFQVNKETNTYESLTLLSGLAPPTGYSLFYPNNCPNNLNCFKDLKEGMAYAKAVNKPILLDFTGYACVNCRKMEEQVWSVPEVDEKIRDNYVLISLYVDDKKQFPEAEQTEVHQSNGNLRKLKNYGHKWAHFQTAFFKTNAQPYYVLLSPDGKRQLNTPVGYEPDADTYANWLTQGLQNL